MSKTVKTRIQNKIDTSSNWAKATTFVPLKGEIIIYSDLAKIKIGDGTTTVGSLPFANAEQASSATSATTASKLESSTIGSTSLPIYLSNGTPAVASNVNKEAYLSWGGKNLSGSFGPIDAAMIPDLGADRFAFIPAKQWTIEYSRDGGATWVDYGASDSQKVALTSMEANLVIGKADSSNLATETYMLRLTLLTSGAVYSALNKFAIFLSTQGSNGCYCTLEGKTKANVDAGNDTWVTFADKVSVVGWSGWNIINTSTITTHGNSSSQYANLRFTFGCTGGSTEYEGLRVHRIKAFGGVGWITPSNMAKYGTIYSYDSSQNAMFPANVYAKNSSGAWKALVRDDDSRLTNSRPASDVYSWAKAATKPSYTASEVGVTETVFPGLKKTGTVKSVTVKMNGEIKGTVTDSGTIDLGTITGFYYDEL